MSSWLRTVRRRFTGRRELGDPVDLGIHTLYQAEVMRVTQSAIKRARERGLRKRTYVADPTEKLRALIQKGIFILIRGLPRTGKTNLALVIWDIASHDSRFTKPALIHNNGGIQDGYFFSDWDEFERLTGTFEKAGTFIPGELQRAGHDLIVMLFDDISKLFKGRRAGAKRTDRLRDMFVECGKKQLFGIAIEHSEKTADIDFTRFSEWVLEKPHQEKPGIDAEVTLRDKKAVDAKRNGVFMWHTDAIPAAATVYDANIPGEWQDTARELRARIAAPAPIVTGLTWRLLSEEDRPDLVTATLEKLKQYAAPATVEMLTEWINGEQQRIIAERHHVSQSTVSTLINQARENGQGYAFPEVWQDQHPSHRVAKGNSQDPDAVDDATKTVYSLKCFIDPKLNVAKAVAGIAQSERALHQQGYTLRLSILELLTRKLFTYEVICNA